MIITFSNLSRDCTPIWVRENSNPLLTYRASGNNCQTKKQNDSKKALHKNVYNQILNYLINANFVLPTTCPFSLSTIKYDPELKFSVGTTN